MEMKFRNDFELFGEAHSRIVMTANKLDFDTIEDICEEFNVPLQIIGTIGGENLRINDLINIPVNDLKEKFETGLGL